MLKNQQFLSIRTGDIPPPTFWRANAWAAKASEGPQFSLSFNKEGRIGILATPIETGLLCTILCGENNAEDLRVIPGALDGLSDMLSIHHGVGANDLTWLFVSGDACKINLAAPVRSMTARMVSVRIQPLKSGIGAGGDLKDVAAIYGMDAATTLRSAMLHFPSMKPLCRSLLPRTKAQRPAVA